MLRTAVRVVSGSVLALILTGCAGKVGPEVAGQPVRLPPTRISPTATPEPSPTPTPCPLMSSPTPQTSPAPQVSWMPTVSLPNGLTPTLDQSVTPTSIGQLDAGMIGQEVTVEGNVVRTGSFSAGFKFTLDDGAGQVVLLVWHDVYDSCQDVTGLNLGARVRATGEVGEYQGELQVQPMWGEEVRVLEPAAAWAELRQIASLGVAHEGQRVMIGGKVVRVEGLESAAKVFVSDDTGEIPVFIWHNVLDRILHNVALGTEGSQVRVVGTVTVYDGGLEVVPTVPYDVTVLP